ncbi:hypothetical protein G7085_09495 [Tessaracoccus sp. HDW20]|uniref:hypothetical protein n=1 Tax=Tessaracoccus coleopterorum TaxID=2714950 RepID=UPI0018D486FF|nr:hypothetical protein [Tessaracoccus coleopterorum]NHB84766.1 hypothetical protein [Tessaracoccus coleopterorum]
MKIGQMAVVDDGDNDRYYIQLSGGLSRISYLEMKAIAQQNKDESDPVPLTDVEVTQMGNAEIPRFSADGIPLGEPALPG